jgi:hypothetical protein
VYVGVGIALFSFYFGLIGHARNVVNDRLRVKNELIPCLAYSKRKIYVFVINKKMVV